VVVCLSVMMVGTFQLTIKTNEGGARTLKAGRRGRGEPFCDAGTAD
jgi:hypothetical protein